MDHYLEIRLLPDPEFPANVLMNALFSKLHRALAGWGGLDVGVSFPDHGKAGLGMRLRLHGSATALAGLMAGDWLKGMRDHSEITAIQPVPAGARHRVVRRVQAKSNPERLRRRRVARGASEDAARAAIPDTAIEHLDLPFVVLTSLSTGQQFRLFIKHQAPADHATPGPFSAYGLSPSSTVPWF